MSWLSSLFSAKEILETGKSAVDAVVFTDQEKNDYFLRYIEATLPMNVSRRIIASGVTFVWVLGAICGIASILLGSPHKKDLADFLSLYVMPSFTVLVSWYFWRRIDKK